ncbi:hypothetical protein [Janthinobacterium sp.]|uniref:hypothetical protein n=1 Tax=Janthinobacterium sp. TaxID=1871054 RepID=UPI00293D7776|nr:hypothetical protein [Janthinobacterium sp.]
MKLVKFAIAAAVAAAFSAPVLADSNTATITEVTNITNDVTVSGTAVVTGVVHVAAETGASADNNQTLNPDLNISVTGSNPVDVKNSANALQGNAGINISAGVGNAQGNEAAMASLGDASAVFASAQTFSTQTASSGASITPNATNTALLESSLMGANGNVGFNLASGSGNLQDNQLAISVRDGTAATGGGMMAKATGTNNQDVSLTVRGESPSTNTVIITDSIGSTGNLGFNMTAGLANLQHNSLSIASAK